MRWILLCEELTNPGLKGAVANKFCTLAPNVYGLSVRSLLHVTLWRVEFCGGY
jgi:hypothetical protein